MNKEDSVKTFELENGDKCWIIEKNFENEMVNIDNSKIKINAYRKPISMTSIFITKDEEYVGHISASIYEDKKASLIMSGIRNLELPEELSFFKDKIEKMDVALQVDEKYRRKGKATELINLMLNYLCRKEIEDLEVDSISDEIAMQTYLKTGAERMDDKNAIYRNIKKILSKGENELERQVSIYACMERRYVPGTIYMDKPLCNAPYTTHTESIAILKLKQ